MTKPAAIGFVFVVSVAIGARIAPAQSPAGASGHWEGTIQTPGQPLAISVDLSDQPAGTWQGTITIPAQNVKGFALSPISAEGESITFGMKGVPGDPLFKGKISKEPRSVAGEFSQGGLAMPFTLAWKGEPKVEAAPTSTAIGKDLEGSWHGALNADGNILRLVVKLANQDGSGRGTVISVDQGGVEIPITTITQNGSGIKLTVSSIGATYEGDLKAGQIEGTWAQGAKSFPLVFKR
jgi:hypothetical protein